MLTRRRLLIAAPLALLIGALIYTAWLTLQVRSDLSAANDSAQRLRDSFENGDPAARDRAIAELQVAAGQAEAHTDGLWWSGLTRLPLAGDDAAGIRALSQSLDTVAADGAQPLGEAVDLLDGMTADGGVDVDVLRTLETPVADAHTAFSDANDQVEGLDSTGYAGSVKSRFDDYADLVSDVDRVLGSAQQATQVLPAMVGADGPRDYLLVFQNNAEIRATGGMPGSWARVHTDAGDLAMVEQGDAGFGERAEPVLPLSDAELEVYNDQLGTYFQDAGFTPDFPRAADLLAARWEEELGGPELDGVIALDPVAMSYLLKGTGPVQVRDRTLTSDNVVDALLSAIYTEIAAEEEQDAFFQEAARAVFEAATGELEDPVEFVRSMSRAAEEGRFLVASFNDAEQRTLHGTNVAGALSGDDGATPHVDIGLNDATGSKMSYYLRYFTEVRAEGCITGRQSLAGAMSLSQSIPPDEAAKLPVSVTGTGQYGTERGSQLVLIRIYGPYGGTVEDIRFNGRRIDATPVQLDGRPVATVVALLSTTRDVRITWSMRTGPGQPGDVKLGVTPSIVPGNKDAIIETAC